MIQTMKLQATVYRKGRRQIVFIIHDYDDSIKVCYYNGKTAHFSWETWPQAIAHEQRLIKAGWQPKHGEES
jgi:hypothetical protein